MARKIDWSKAKEFFFNHGEKIALGSCAFIALTLGLWGVWSARSAGRADGGKTWPEAFDAQAKRIRSEMAQAQPPVVDGKDFEEKQYAWGPISSLHTAYPYSAFREGASDKRDKPRALAIVDNPKSIQVDYIVGLTYAHDKGFSGGGGKHVKGLEPAGAVGNVPMPPPNPKLKGQPQTPQELLPFVKVGQPRRMIVVHAVFPMAKQMAEFRKALKMFDQGDMLLKNPDDLPRILGIDVQKIEVDPQGKTKIIHLLGFDKNNSFDVDPGLDKLMRESIYDERSAEMLQQYIWHGLCTPMPKLANRPYPKFEFAAMEDIDWAMLEDPERKDALMAGPGFQPPPRQKEGGTGVVLPGAGKTKNPPEKGPMMPPEMGPKVAAVEYKIKEMPELTFKDSHPTLISRLFGKRDEKDSRRLDSDVNVYHVLGEFARTAPKDTQPGTPNPLGQDRYQSAWHLGEVPGAGGVGGVGGEGGLRTPTPPPGPGGLEGGGKKPVLPGQNQPPQGPAHPDWKRDALVRFVDVDVKPGYTYSYAVRVRLANPNFGKDAFGKDKDVAFAQLAASPALDPSPWVTTPARTIPQEYSVYAIDQQLVDDLADNRVAKASQTYNAAFFSTYTPFQIHQWADRKKDVAVTIGEPYVIGDWVIGERQFVKKGDYIGRRVNVQIPVWNKALDAFEVPQHKDPASKDKKNPPTGAFMDLTVDDKAPLLVDFAGGKRLHKISNTLEEETAVDALVLMPDGKLMLLNSRDASDPAKQAGKERHDRVLEYRQRIQEIRSGGGGAPAMPKEGPGPRLPGPKGGGSG